MTVATIAAVVGTAAGGLSIYNGLKGGGGQQGGSGSANTYVPTGLGSADQQWQDYFKSMAGPMSTLNGAVSQMAPTGYTDVLNVPVDQLQNMGYWAGQADKNAAGLAQSNMNSMVNLASGQNALGNYINDQGMQLWNTALDPQKQLQAQLQQQVQDASRSNASSAGLGTSGAGVGTEDKAMTDFLINWQNQQLQRQIAGMGGLNSALKTGQGFENNVGKDLSAAQAFGSSIPGYLMASATDPYNMNMTAAAQPFTALDMYGKSITNNMIQPTNQAMSGAIPYMNSGQGATNQAFNQGQDNLYNTIYGAKQLTNPQNWQAMMSAFNTPSTDYVANSTYNPNYDTGGYTGSSWSGNG